jgi:hypothetical protein
MLQFHPMTSNKRVRPDDSTVILHQLLIKYTKLDNNREQPEEISHTRQSAAKATNSLNIDDSTALTMR